MRRANFLQYLVAWLGVPLSVLGFFPSGGCVTESHQKVEPQAVEAKDRPYVGLKRKIVIGKVQNKSPYLRGVFADDTDRLGNQAKEILKNHLSQTRRFILVERDNLDEMAREVEIGGTTQRLTAARVLITGAVTEFGRRETGAHALGGLLGRSKTQTAYAKVSFSIVDIETSQTLFSIQGAGEYELSNEEVLGFGSRAGYDATLNDKVLNLAIIAAVDKLVEGLEQGQWQIPVES